MSTAANEPPYVYEGLDPVRDPQSMVTIVCDRVKDSVKRIGDAIDAGRRPGMPLSVLTNVVREAPLGSLIVAFLLGVALARRR